VEKGYCLETKMSGGVFYFLLLFGVWDGREGASMTEEEQAMLEKLTRVIDGLDSAKLTVIQTLNDCVNTHSTKDGYFNLLDNYIAFGQELVKVEKAHRRLKAMVEKAMKS
jgi:hypothetical protein